MTKKGILRAMQRKLNCLDFRKFFGFTEMAGKKRKKAVEEESDSESEVPVAARIRKEKAESSGLLTNRKRRVYGLRPSGKKTAK